MMNKQSWVSALYKITNKAEVITISQFCRFIGCSQNTARKLLEPLDYVRFGRCCYYAINDIADLMVRNYGRK